jgi:hypothetical protein
MNRELLFDINSELYSGHLDVNIETTCSSSTLTDTNTTSPTSDDEPVVDIDSAVDSCPSGGLDGQEQEQCEGPVALKVRVEGDMYDIITTSADEIFSAIH